MFTVKQRLEKTVKGEHGGYSAKEISTIVDELNDLGGIVIPRGTPSEMARAIIKECEDDLPRGEIYIASFKLRGEWAPLPRGTTRVNVTTCQRKAHPYRRDFSPMHPREHKGYYCFENYWQAGKVFEGLDRKKQQAWWKKLQKCKRTYAGPGKDKAKRVLYSIYPDGKQRGYIDSRKEVYVPEYYKIINKTESFNDLVERVNSGESFTIYDLDGPKKADGSPDVKKVSIELLREKINDARFPFGHGYVVAASVLGILPKEYCTKTVEEKEGILTIFKEKGSHVYEKPVDKGMENLMKRVERHLRDKMLTPRLKDVKEARKELMPAWYHHKHQYGLTKRFIMTLQKGGGAGYIFSNQHTPGRDWKTIDGFQEIVNIINKEYGENFTLCHANMYLEDKKGNMSQLSRHSDDETEMNKGKPIVCLSMGNKAMRLYLFRKGEKKKVVQYEVRPYSIYVMGGDTQDDMDHQLAALTKTRNKAYVVPKGEERVRISLTFRVESNAERQHRKDTPH